MSFGMLVIIVSVPILGSIAGLIFGLVKKNNIVILFSGLILLAALIYAITLYFAIMGFGSAPKFD